MISVRPLQSTYYCHKSYSFSFYTFMLSLEKASDNIRFSLYSSQQTSTENEFLDWVMLQKAQY